MLVGVLFVLASVARWGPQLLEWGPQLLEWGPQLLEWWPQLLDLAKGIAATLPPGQLINGR